MPAPLAAQAFFADPRVTAALAVLLQTLREHSDRLTGPRPADPALALSYRHMLDAFGQQRSGPLYFPYLGSGLGHGALVELSDGSVKYDMISGIGVHYLGHSHPRLVEAGLRAALTDTVMQGNLQQNQEVPPLLASLLTLANESGATLAHAFLTTSGAMANENALKLILQKKAPARRMLAFAHGFAGRTLALSQITDKPQYRVGLPEVLAVDYVPFLDEANPVESTRAAVEALRGHLARHPGQYAGMCMELVLGEGGYSAGTREFFLAVIAELQSHQVTVWLDEVQTFGRTERPFAFQYFGLDEAVEIVTVGKLTQLCATLFTEDYQPQPGLLSQTFTASTAAIFAAQVLIDLMTTADWFGPTGRIARLRTALVEGLQAIGRRHPGWITGPFGLGAMIAFTPFDGRDAVVKKLLRALFDAGVIAFYAGSAPTRIRFLMPVGAISEADIATVCRILEESMAEVAGAA